MCNVLRRKKTSITNNTCTVTLLWRKSVSSSTTFLNEELCGRLWTQCTLHIELLRKHFLFYVKATTFSRRFGNGTGVLWRDCSMDVKMDVKSSRVDSCFLASANSSVHTACLGTSCLQRYCFSNCPDLLSINLTENQSTTRRAALSFSYWVSWNMRCFSAYVAALPLPVRLENLILFQWKYVNYKHYFMHGLYRKTESTSFVFYLVFEVIDCFNWYYRS